MSKKRTYLTIAEAMSWGQFLHSDLRRLLKQRDARQKAEQDIQNFTTWAHAVREVTKEDMKLWRRLYDEGVRDFNRLPDDPAQLQLLFHKTEASQDIERWEAAFKCNRCGSEGRENFTYIESIVTGELHQCYKCEEKSVFPHEPKKRKR